MDLENTRNLLEQSLRRLKVRLLELSAWCDRDRQFVDQGEFCAGPGADWSVLRSGESWPALGAPVEIRFVSLDPRTLGGVSYSRPLSPWRGSAPLRE